MSSSSLLLLALITLVLLFIFPSSMAVVDIDGEQLRNGGNYYIGLVTAEGGLTFSQKNGESPLYITSTKNDNSPGTPVNIWIPARIPDIFANNLLGFTFKGSMPCGVSPTWTKINNESSQKAYITADGDDEYNISRMSFVIGRENKSNKLPVTNENLWSSNMYSVVRTSGFSTEIPTHVV